MVELVEIGILAALGAWGLTQIHLLFSIRAVKRDIDAKRKGTEAFVSTNLAGLEKTFLERTGALTASMDSLKEEVPSSPQAELDALRSEFSDFAKEIGKTMAELPSVLELRFRQQSGRESQEMMATARELNAGVKTELAAVNAQITPEMAGDIRGKILKAIAREPTPKERKEMGMVGEMIWNFGRMRAAEWLQSNSSPGTSMTYRVQQNRTDF